MSLLEDPRVIYNRGVFSARLAEAMEGKSHKPSTLATVLELQSNGAKWNPNLIKDWMEGNKDPKFCVVVTLAKALGVSPNYLAGLTENKSSNISKEEAKEALGLERLSDEAIESLSKLLDYTVGFNDQSDILRLLTDLSRWDHYHVRPRDWLPSVDSDESAQQQAEENPPGEYGHFPSVSTAELVEYLLTRSQEMVRRIFKSVIRIMDYHEAERFFDCLKKREDADLDNSNSTIRKYIKKMQELDQLPEDQFSKAKRLEKLKNRRERQQEKLVRGRITEEAILEDAIRTAINKYWQENIDGHPDTQSARESLVNALIESVHDSFNSNIITHERLLQIRAKE